MITNQQLELYNEAAMNVLINSSKFNGRSRVKLLAASRQAALETITQSDDGLHLPESTRSVVGRHSTSSSMLVTAVALPFFIFLRLIFFLSPFVTVLSGSHDPYELYMQQTTEAHRWLLLPDTATPKAFPETLSLFFPGLSLGVCGSPCPRQQSPPATCSPRHGEPRGEEASHCGCTPRTKGAFPGSLQDGCCNGLLLPV